MFSHLFSKSMSLQLIAPGFSYLFKAGKGGNPHHAKDGKFTSGPGGGKSIMAPDEEYAGAPKKIVSYYQGKLENMAPALRQSVKEYTGEDYGCYDDMNKLLRGLKSEKDLDKYEPGTSTLTKKNIQNLDRAMESCKLPEDVEVHRGIGGEFASDLINSHADGKLVGEVVEDKGYMSTSLDQNVAQRWSPDVNLVLSVKKGHSAMYLESLTVNSAEHEVLLPRGTRYRITGAQEDDNGRLFLYGQVLDS